MDFASVRTWSVSPPPTVSLSTNGSTSHCLQRALSQAQTLQRARRKDPFNQDLNF